MGWWVVFDVCLILLYYIGVVKQPRKNDQPGGMSTSSCWMDDIEVGMGKGTSKLKTTSIGVFSLVKEYFD